MNTFLDLSWVILEKIHRVMPDLQAFGSHYMAIFALQENFAHSKWFRLPGFLSSENVFLKWNMTSVLDNSNNWYYWIISSFFRESLLQP